MTLFQSAALVLGCLAVSGFIVCVALLAAYLKDQSEFDQRLSDLDDELRARDERLAAAEQKISRAGLDFFA